MIIIGLTGGIGSGKSTVLEMFKGLGVETYIADVEAKRLMNTNPELITDIKKLIGEKAYIDQKLNRAFISNVVFNNKDTLTALNALVHPKVRSDFKNFIKKSSSKIIIYEAAILFESGSDKFCDYIVTVSANFEDKIKRIIKRDGVSKEQVLERMQHQLNDESKIRKSHFVVNNSNLSDTKIQVETIFNILVKLDKK
ncbi:dephospho-CoA kinase [Lutibacter flavus]|uniref:Dephospho-CoA kinase n=1 Tax=Lutibacter flavus TaxID=691689 RepID=A0A238VB65_9FLAO|nr:dephospho-CoA kinase [Lutibacter flavus]SNR31650.1 dephospho-CoA kinase [Lutibacter flavus]